MNPSSASAGSSSARPTSSIPLQSLSIPSVQSREEAQARFQEHERNINWHAEHHNLTGQQQAYKEMVAFLDSLRPQGFFSESEINAKLEELYYAYSLFERRQGEDTRANELAEKAASFAHSLVQTSPRKHKLDRVDSSPFHYAKSITPTCLDRPQGIPSDPEFDALIQRIQGMDIKKDVFLFPNTSSAASSHAQQAFNWPTSPYEIKETAQLASCLREAIRQPPTSDNFHCYEELAERVLLCFEKMPSCTLSLVQEVILLAQAADNQGYYRRLIYKLQIDPKRILNMAALQGLTVIIQNRARSVHIASDSNLAGDCTELLKYIHRLLARTHHKENAIQLNALLQTVSVLLDTMFEARLKLDAETFKGSLEECLTVLGKAQDTKSEVDASLTFQAKYALQALKRLRYPREKLERLWDILQDFSGGAAYAAGAFGSKDPDKFWEAINRIGEGVKKIKQEWDAYYKRQEWYLALYRIEQGIRLGYLKELVPFVQGWTLPKKNYLLQGLCFHLERIALSRADENAKGWALSFLKHLEQGGTEWGHDKDLVGVKACASATLVRIGHFWRLPNTQLMERVDYAPPAWHPFWQGESQNKLLTAVREKEQRHHDQQLLPVINDAVVSLPPTLALLRGDVTQASANVTQSHLELSSKVSAIEQHLRPKRPKPSSEWLLEANKALAQHYQPALKIQRISGKELDLADCYINLAIVEAPAQRKGEKEKLQKQAAMFHRFSSYEKVANTNTHALIPLEELFNARLLRDKKEGSPKKILVQGCAGIGKTTLCKKLLHAYQNGLWNDRFDAVLWLPLRQLKTYTHAYGLKDVLRQKYFPNSEKLANALYDRVDKVLFILDGLDEVATDIGQDNRIGKLLEELFQQTHIIFTSRPSGVEPSALPKLDLELETMGFSPEDVQTYLNTIEPQKAEEIQAFIDRTPMLQGLVNIPIQLDVLCYSWDAFQSQLSAGGVVTVTALYQAMVDKLWRKDGERLEKAQAGKLLTLKQIHSLRPYQIEKQLVSIENEYLSYLAFQGLLDNHRIEFDETALQDAIQALNEQRETIKQNPLPFQLLDDIKQTSFLYTADAELEEAQRTWHFLHLTFQEFFAAKYVAQHLQAYSTAAPAGHLMMDQVRLYRFIAENKYNPRYEIVWWMVAGLLKDGPLEHFFTLLEQAPRDLIGGRHQQMMTGCLNEARTQLEKIHIDRLETEFMQWLCLEFKLSKADVSELGRQRNFPEHLLLMNLNQLEGQKVQMIRTLGARPTLSKAALSALSNALWDDNKDVRSAAADALGDQKMLQEPALSDLIYVLRDKDDDEDVRAAAARALGEQKMLQEPALSDLIYVLQDEDENEDVRSAAARALGGQATLSEAAVQALIDVLKDEENWGIMYEVVRALGEQKTPLPELAIWALIGAYQHENEDVRYEAVMALREQKKIPDFALSALIDALRDKAQSVSVGASLVLDTQKALPEPALSTLIGMLRDENQSVRVEAFLVLDKQKTLPEPIFSTLIGMLRDENQSVRDNVTSVLSKQKTLPEPIFSTLTDMLQDEDKFARAAAAIILSKQKALPEPALSTLTDMLQDEEVRFAAARALGEQEQLPEPILSTLTDMLRNEDEDVRSAAARALGEQEILLEFDFFTAMGHLKDEDENMRSATASVLGEQKELPDFALSALIDALKDEENWEVRSEVARALGEQKELPDFALSALIDALWDKDIRSDAASALGEQKTLPDFALSALIDACQNQDKDVGSAAASVLGAHLDLLYALLPSLALDQIQALYVKFLFAYSCKHVAPLYIQDNQLHFYTGRGPGQTDRIAEKKINEITQAFGAAQKREELL